MDRAAANAGVAVAVATARASCIPRLRNPMACPQSPYVHCCTDPTRSACTRFIRDRPLRTYFPLCPWVPIVRVCACVCASTSFIMQQYFEEKRIGHNTTVSV